MTRVRKLLRDDLKSYQARAEAVRTAQIYRSSLNSLRTLVTSAPRLLKNAAASKVRTPALVVKSVSYTHLDAVPPHG